MRPRRRRSFCRFQHAGAALRRRREDRLPAGLRLARRAHRRVLRRHAARRRHAPARHRPHGRGQDRDHRASEARARLAARADHVGFQRADERQPDAGRPRRPNREAAAGHERGHGRRAHDVGANDGQGRRRHRRLQDAQAADARRAAWSLVQPCSCSCTPPRSCLCPPRRGEPQAPLAAVGGALGASFVAPLARCEMAFPRRAGCVQLPRLVFIVRILAHMLPRWQWFQSKRCLRHLRLPGRKYCGAVQWRLDELLLPGDVRFLGSFAGV